MIMVRPFTRFYADDLRIEKEKMQTLIRVPLDRKKIRIRGMRKMNLEYWKQFENSGRIEDYLSFVACGGQENSGMEGQAGEYRDAGIYMCDRDHIKADSRGGIRQTY